MLTAIVVALAALMLYSALLAGNQTGLRRTVIWIAVAHGASAANAFLLSGYSFGQSVLLISVLSVLALWIGGSELLRINGGNGNLANLGAYKRILFIAHKGSLLSALVLLLVLPYTTLGNYFIVNDQYPLSLPFWALETTWALSDVSAVLLGFALFRYVARVFGGPRRDKPDIYKDETIKEGPLGTATLLTALMGLGFLAALCPMTMDTHSEVDWGQWFPWIMSSLVVLFSLGFAFIANAINGNAWKMTHKMMQVHPMEIYMNLDNFAPNMAKVKMGDPKIDKMMPKLAKFSQGLAFKASRGLLKGIKKLSALGWGE